MDQQTGNSRDPVGDARIHAMLFYRTPESLNQRFSRSKNIEKGIYNVESWLDHHAVKLHQRFSLNSYKFLISFFAIIFNSFKLFIFSLCKWLIYPL